MTTEPRSKLSTRLAAAAARITATRATAAQQASPATPAPTQATPAAPKPARNRKPARSAANHASDERDAQVNATSAKGTRKGGSDEDRSFMGGNVAKVAASLRAQARNPDALQLVSDDELVEIARAMVENAKQRGSTGAMDRQALFRAAGLPFVATGAGKAGAQAGGSVVRDRLQAALNRGRRQAAVTGAAKDGQEVSEIAA